jgi:N6-L-threonylcarbamoyladenine synthase
MRALTLLRLRPRLPSSQPPRPSLRRALLTLAIETSCDDTSVAILEAKTCPTHGHTSAVLHFHDKVTSNNTSFHGVHPIVSLYSHQESLAGLLDEAIRHLPCAGTSTTTRVPDFVSVTRGPGMRSNLFTGLDTAKGLAVAWQRPLIGVHHMQAHALTPRLVKALQNAQEDGFTAAEYPSRGEAYHREDRGLGVPQSREGAANVVIEPNFPFLSVLASGGHTLLVSSETLTDHKVLASTTDIAIGECLDKIARSVLPPEILDAAQSTMYGALLEQFAFKETPTSVTDRQITEPKLEEQPARGKEQQSGRTEYRLENITAKDYVSQYGTRYKYVMPKNNEEAIKQNTTKWGWAFNKPLSKGAGGLKSHSMEMSFTGLLTQAERVVQFESDPSSAKLTKNRRSAAQISAEERIDMARETMRAAFEHLSSRVVLALQSIASEGIPVNGVVLAGGVAANSYLKFMYAAFIVHSRNTDWWLDLRLSSVHMVTLTSES